MASQPIIIALMGPMGSGKSNFINKLTGSKDCSTRQHMHPIGEVTLSLSGNRQYVFVDTTGSGTAFRSGHDILYGIAEWLETKYRREVKLTGIIYTHSITDNRMSGSVWNNLEMFTWLCGERAAEHVRFVTTMWDKVTDAHVAESRVSQLEADLWKPLMDAGSRHERFENTFESAWEIMRGLVGEEEAPLLREDLVDAGRRLNETTAGKALYTRFQKLLHEQKGAIKQIREEAKTRKCPEVKQLEAETKRVEDELQKTWCEMRKLKIPFLACTAPFFPTKHHLSSALQIAENDYVIFVVGSTGAEKNPLH